jgi:hypothetical protein
LLSFLTLRSVDRNAYRRRRLSVSEKAALTVCLTGGLSIDWHEGIKYRWRVAQLSAVATGIRLRCPEAFVIHQRIIDWDHAQSPSGIPARAIGVASPTLRLMRWGMRRWERTRLLNRLGGALTAAAQMDYLPGLASAAYFVLRRSSTGDGTPEDLMEIGRGIQRFWLTATRLGLAMQPVLAPLAFAHYGERGTHFSSEPGLTGRAETLAQSFRKVLGVAAAEVVFIGRIGEPKPRLPTHRSVRRPLAELMG